LKGSSCISLARETLASESSTSGSPKARSFGEKLMPLLQEVGIEEQPEIYTPHTFVSATSAVRA
jgi:hypothetical protein